jgi:hypothetical protein
LKAYVDLSGGHVQCFELSQCSKAHRTLWDSYGSMWLPLVMQSVSKRALQWYSKCYCVASITKTFTLKGGQTVHRPRCWMDNLYAFKYKCFRNTRHTVTFGIPLLSSFLNTLH